ncbi:sperm acrosome membrane-associated protein 6 [Emydura macquarii macquarii]|uniref:sperm acrosome membrane-associated protein 6 n=1 Tax=Emydura macquarii macquarii TaxID=1129001 RepID=UPI00352A9A3D
MPAATQFLLPLCLGLLLAPRAPGCLYCFSTPQQRLRVCQTFLGHTSPQHVTCLGTLRAAFQPYTRLVVGVAEMEKLKDTFSSLIFSLEEKGLAKVSYQLAIPEAVARIQPELAQLKPARNRSDAPGLNAGIWPDLDSSSSASTAPACVPPCGYQKDAQVYKCASCSLVECQLPLDCPVEDVWKNEGNRTTLKCRVQFQTPPEVQISWKFAKDLRTRDLSLFRNLQLDTGSSLILQPTRALHRGTYACQLALQDDVLARKYFYLNVTGSSQGSETELQDMFRAILQSPAGQGTGRAGGQLPQLSELLAEPDSLRKRNVVLLMVGLALSSMLGTLLLGGICCWAMGRP